MLAYEYDELSAKAKTVAIEKAREWECNDPVACEMISEDFKSYLLERGLPEDVQWRLSCCQGDGVAFYGKVDVKKYTEFYNLREWGPMEDLVDVTIDSTSSHYHHQNTMRVEHERWDDHEECEHSAAWWISRHVDDLVEHVKSTIKVVSCDLEQRGYAELEYRDSQEYLEDTIRANDWLFDECGMYLPSATKVASEQRRKKNRAVACCAPD
jgi:hypothetical protein